MKTIKYLPILLLAVLMVSSCDEETVSYGDAQQFVRDDTWPALSVLTKNVTFLQGTPSYDFEFLASAGTSSATKAVVYKTFTDSRTGNQSDTAVLAEFTLGSSSYFEATTTFDELRAGLTLNGSALPTDEGDIGIGSKWTLLYTLVSDGGEQVLEFSSANSTSISVLSPFAGDYKVIASDYWRIGVQSDLADFTGETRFIGSVNDTTFLHTEYIGPLGPSTGFEGLDFIFYKSGNSVVIPAEVDGETQPNWGTYFTTCQDDASDLTNVHCGSSNKFVIDVSGAGKHKIYLSYGYYTVGSGPREFYEVLEKIVE